MNDLSGSMSAVILRSSTGKYAHAFLQEDNTLYFPKCMPELVEFNSIEEARKFGREITVKFQEELKLNGYTSELEEYS